MVPIELILKLVPKSVPLGQRFKDITPIGETGGGGAFSVVFKAVELATQRPVALKFFWDRGDTYRKLAFEREARLLWSLFRDEPLFVQCIAPPDSLTVEALVPDIGPWPISLPFLALEWAAHGSGERHCTAPQHWNDICQRLKMFRSMCRAVSRFHNLKCNHRDLKPGNFLVFDAETVKLSDFGTAKLVAPTEPDLINNYSGPVGDLRYSAPETFAAFPATLRRGQLADIFGLGATLFEMLTGQTLWTHTQRATMEIRKFTSTLQGMPPSQRETSFLDFIERQSWPIPKVRSINERIPRCVHHQLNQIVAELAHRDYRMRTQTLDRVHRIVRICELRLVQDAKRRERRARRPGAPVNA